MKTELLIIGGDGDLAIRKLYPALFSLELHDELSGVGRVVGMSRKLKDRSSILDSVHGNVAQSDGFDEPAWQTFCERITLVEGDATSVEDMEKYAESVELEDTQLTVYFAIPPKIFQAVCVAMQQAGLVTENTRVVVEKPLGTDLESFVEVNDQLSTIFKEEQVYRIDHYLGKEPVQGLLALRFANTIFGSIWNGNLIDHVQISVTETVGIEDRHEFYDEIGALRDMVQNHLLQILCLLAMEPPANRSADMIRTEKLKVLKSLRPINLEKINSHTVRGQYAAGTAGKELVDGYQDEIGREQESTTETFVAVKAEINNWRWADVPFYLRTGKRMANKCSEILIQFKAPKYNIFSEQTLNLPANQVLIRLQPDEGVHLRFLNKHPGVGDLPMETLELSLDSPNAKKRFNYDAYARLLLEVMRGDQTLFVSSEEVKASWEWIDEIRANWDTAKSKAYPYSAGSMGPSQSVVMLARDDREWADTDY